MSDDETHKPPQASDGHQPFHEVMGPAQATGQMQPVQIGLGFAVHQGGAYPSEQVLETLERHSVGAVARVLTMSEKAQQAQIDATALAQEHARADVVRGSWQGTGVTVLAMTLALICGLLGHDTLGVVFLGVPVLSVARALIMATRPRGNQPPMR